MLTSGAGGGASVRRRGSTWTVILDAGPDPATGKRPQRWKGGYKTRKAAEAALRELVADVDRGAYVARSSVTLGAYLDEWLETVHPRLRPTTWNSYRIAAARVANSLGATPFSPSPLRTSNASTRISWPATTRPAR